MATIMDREEWSERDIWQHYTELAARTAVYPEENELRYLIAGLISETGELWGLIASALRDDPKMEEQAEEHLQDECGDLLWMQAMLRKALQAEPLEAFLPVSLGGFALWREPLWNAWQPVIMLSEMATLVAVNLEEADMYRVSKTLDRVGVATQVIIKNGGLTLEEVAAHNIRKLTRRATAGTLRKGTR